jgi:dienelactone hydrolase
VAQGFPDAWRAGLERSRGALGAFVTQNLAAVEPHAIADAPVAQSAKPYPVILLQPGLGPSHPDYATLAEDLASRGYIIVASTPTYSANVLAFPDGRVVGRSDAATVPDALSPEEAKARLDELVGVWAADEIFLMNRLGKLNAGAPNRGVVDARFKGRFDLDKVGVMGHSFGGASAAETCSLDARCKAGVDLDGSPYGSVIATGLRQPFLFVWSEPGLLGREAQAQTARDVRTLRSHSWGQIYELTIHGARHFNFADYAVLYEPLLRPMQMLGSIDGRRGLSVAATYVAAFFDQSLKGVPQPLLDGPSPSYPEVRFGS